MQWPSNQPAKWESDIYYSGLSKGYIDLFDESSLQTLCESGGTVSPSNTAELNKLIRVIDQERQGGKPQVCLVENIGPDLIGVFGSAWGVDPAFFVGHAENSPAELMWKTRWGQEWGQQQWSPRAAHHLSGVFEYSPLLGDGWDGDDGESNWFPRRWSRPRRETNKVCRISTSISYFLVDNHLCMSYRRMCRPSLMCTFRSNACGCSLVQQSAPSDSTDPHHLTDAVHTKRGGYTAASTLPRLLSRSD